MMHARSGQVLMSAGIEGSRLCRSRERSVICTRSALTDADPGWPPCCRHPCARSSDWPSATSGKTSDATALDALADGLGVERLLTWRLDADGVMRFKASCGLSEIHCCAVEGHSLWTPGAGTLSRLVLMSRRTPHCCLSFLVISAEGIAVMGFIPLSNCDRAIGKFTLDFAAPHALSAEDLQLVMAIAAQVAFAVERTRTEETARRSEERLRFALDAAAMGTWDWDLSADRVVWSDNLERIHGLPPGTFDGSFASYEREIHPDDRPRVLASARKAIAEGVPHEVEYRIVAPDGSIRWCEGKGRVESRMDDL